jgi:hypothetical protein
MRISGFSFVRNGIKLYYPVLESIRSVLPICYEFVIAVGRGDADDTTREEILALNEPKIRIIDTVWDEKWTKGGMIHAVQTDIAMKACTGDWLFYVQGDEVVHEQDLPKIEKRCAELLSDRRVEGLLFRYKHFWGDYGHYHTGHGWYPNEIRIVRNRPHIHSYQSAQSFRWFDYWESPRQEKGTRKLNVAKVDAEIYHYGWVRPPRLMKNKCRVFHSTHWGKAKAEAYYDSLPEYYDYGPLSLVSVYRGSHPAVMKDRIAAMDWSGLLQKDGKPQTNRKPHKHELPRVRLLSWIERNLLFGHQVGTFHNYHLIRRPHIASG